MVDAPADLDFGARLDNGSLTGLIGMLNRSVSCATCKLEFDLLHLLFLHIIEVIDPPLMCAVAFCVC